MSSARKAPPPPETLLRASGEYLAYETWHREPEVVRGSGRSVRLTSLLLG